MRKMIYLIFVLVGTTTTLSEAWSSHAGRANLMVRPVTVCRSRGGGVSTQLGAKKDNKPPPPAFLFQEFKTAKGEVLDPYKVLKIKQTATTNDIKQAYRNLSRKYHADATRFRDVLPGRCNNVEEVRDEWERIKLAYEILRDPKLRLRYDRNVVIADPGAAMQRAAMEAMGKGIQGVGQAVGKGLFGVGKGLWDVSAFTLEKITSKTEEGKDKPATTTTFNKHTTANIPQPDSAEPKEGLAVSVVNKELSLTREM